MKEKIVSFIEAIKNKVSSHYDIGMAVHEEDEHDDMAENKPSAHKHNFKEKLAVAESTKDRIIEKLRGNLMYIVIAVLIIVPGLFKLVGFFQEPAAAPTQIAKSTPFGEAPQTTVPVEDKQIPQDTFETLLAQQNQIPSSASDFSQAAQPEEAVNTAAVPEETASEEAVNTAPITEAAAPEEVIQTTPVPESAPPEEVVNTAPVTEFTPEPMSEVKPAEDDKEKDDSRSMLASLFSFGDGSEKTSDNMAKEKAVPAENAPAATVAGIPGATTAAKSQTADQILQNYAVQESKIEDQLNKLLSRMDKLEDSVATVSEIEDRLVAIENSNQIAADQQLQIVHTKLAQLEQGIKQINQQAAKTIAAPAANTTNMSQNNNVAAVQNTNATPVVTVEAVIPGRAWVRNQDGVLMVVQVGDEINGVGKVTRIDAREGTVATATYIFRQ